MQPLAMTSGAVMQPATRKSLPRRHTEAMIAIARRGLSDNELGQKAHPRKTAR